MRTYLISGKKNSLKRIEAKDKWDAIHQFFREYGEHHIAIKRATIKPRWGIK